MKVYSGITDAALIKQIKTNAKAVGLDKIDYKGFYLLKKLGAKNKSTRGYPDAFVAGRGSVSLVGKDEFVWIVVEGIREWFKTSPVLSCKKTKEGYKIETENSYYLLVD